jgi:hypothetical protein
MSKDEYQFSFPLSKPVKFGEDTVSTIHYNEPVGRNWRKLRLQKDGVPDQSSLIDVFTSCSDQTPAFFDRIGGKDYIDILQIVGNFLDAGQATG